MTPQSDVQAENLKENNLLEETAEADLTLQAGQPINGSSSLQSEAVSLVEVAAETATEPCTPTNTDSLSTDPARWGKIDKNVHAYWVQTGPGCCQNKDTDVKVSEHHYKHQKSLKLISNSSIGMASTCSREWLHYTNLSPVVYFVLLAPFLARVTVSPFLSLAIR